MTTHPINPPTAILGKIQFPINKIQPKGFLLPSAGIIKCTFGEKFFVRQPRQGGSDVGKRKREKRNREYWSLGGEIFYKMFFGHAKAMPLRIDEGEGLLVGDEIMRRS